MNGNDSEFQVISSAGTEDACIEAQTSGPRDVALREAMHYAAQYAEDGPVSVVEQVEVARLGYPSGNYGPTSTPPADAALADDPRDIRDEEITLEASDYARRMMQDLGYAQHESRDPLAQNHKTIAAAKHFTHALAAAALRARAVPDGSLPDDLRAAGLAVAVHNDYRLNGTPCTFWLFVGPDGMSYKGEGRTDADALNQVRAMLAASKSGQ